jgi:hypothetical protein
VIDFPALLAQTYTALFGAGVSPPQNSLSIYDASGNLLPFGIRRYDGTTCCLDWQDDFAAANKTVYLYWHPTLDPGSSLANPTGVYDAATRGVWHLEDAGPTTVADATSNANHGTQSGGVAFGATGQVGKCCEWDGSDDFVNCGTDSSIDNLWQSGAALEAWIYPETAGESGGGCIASKSNNLLRCATVTSNLGLTFRAEWSTAGQWLTTSQVGPFNAWYHVMISYLKTLTANEPTLWVNGSPVALTRTNTPSGSATSDAAANLLLGDAPAANRSFDGYLDEIVYHASLRSQAWANARYLFGLGTPITIGTREAYAAAGARLFTELRHRMFGGPGMAGRH